MNIITLTTDFGQSDYSVAALKGALYSRVPEVRLVDISHQIAPYDILQGAYVLSRAYKHFPQGTLHLIGIDAEQTPWQRQLLVCYQGHFFLGADNGILSLVCSDTDALQIFEINRQQGSCPFPSLEIFPQIAQEFFSGVSPHHIGTESHRPLKDLQSYGVNVASNKIIGSIIYIDHYGNAVSNITKELFDATRDHRDFEIFVAGQRFTQICHSYNEFAFTCSKISDLEGEAMLLFNHSQHLELALYKSNMSTVGGASSLLGVRYHDQIAIYFKD